MSKATLSSSSGQAMLGRMAAAAAVKGSANRQANKRRSGRKRKKKKKKKVSRKQEIIKELVRVPPRKRMECSKRSDGKSQDPLLREKK